MRCATHNPQPAPQRTVHTARTYGWRPQWIVGSQLMQVVIFGAGIVSLLLLVMRQSTGGNKRRQPLRRDATNRTEAQHVEEGWMPVERSPHMMMGKVV